MPTYNSKCMICGRVHEYNSNIANRNYTPLCCNRNSEKVILEAPLMAMVDDKPHLAQKFKALY